MTTTHQHRLLLTLPFLLWVSGSEGNTLPRQGEFDTVSAQVNGNSSEPTLSAIRKETVGITEATWSQGQYPVGLTPVGESVCFLTGMTGRFEGGGEYLHVLQSGDTWYLTGDSKQVGVAGSAGCTGLPPGTVVTREASWTQGQPHPTTYLGSASDQVCFLTGISGKFEGGGESVRVYIDEENDSWYLTVSSQQHGVSAHARCLTVSHYSTEQWWQQGNTPTPLGHTSGLFCALTYVSGKFEGGGESVHIWKRSGSSYLGGSSMQAGVTAGARCFLIDPG